MKYLYYCNSPYQLFNVINLNWQRKFCNFENIDKYSGELIISNTFNGAEEIFNILKNDDMFSSVTLSNRLRNSNLLHKVSTFLDFVFPKRYINKSTNQNANEFKNKYQCLCFPKVTSVMLAIWTLNKNARIELYEEGFGTYCGGKHMSYEKSTRQWIYEILVGNRKFSDSYENIYVNNVSLYLDDDKEKIIKIPTIDSKCIDRLLKIFKSILINENSNRVFWLGQYIKDNVNNVMKEALQIIENKVVYIPHPRFKYPLTNNFIKLESNRFWELNINKIDDIENICLITMHSTAVFSPKILYDKEPYLILTYYMIEDEHEIEDNRFVEEIIKRFVLTYRNPEKIMLPKNKQELDDCIKLYLSKTNLV